MKSAFLAIATALFLGCGGGAVAPPAAGSEEDVAIVVDPATAGSVSGQVAYRGAAIQPVTIDMSSDPACAAAHEPALAQDVVTNANGTLRNALVFIKDGLPKGRFPVPSSPPTLDQRGCMYHPRVIGVMVGQDVEILNSDQTTHNIHPVPRENREWNRSQLSGSVPLRDRFAHEEIAIPVKCNVHPWMKAWVAVLEHPYFAVTGEDGSFEIRNLPPGEYTLEVWHEKLGTSEQKVKVDPGQAAHVDFALAGAGA